MTHLVGAAACQADPAQTVQEKKRMIKECQKLPRSLHVDAGRASFGQVRHHKKNALSIILIVCLLLFDQCSCGFCEVVIRTLEFMKIV
jgi:hypothetical protein